MIEAETGVSCFNFSTIIRPVNISAIADFEGRPQVGEKSIQAINNDRGKYIIVLSEYVIS
jgi:hypothetical protein